MTNIAIGGDQWHAGDSYAYAQTYGGLTNFDGQTWYYFPTRSVSPKKVAELVEKVVTTLTKRKVPLDEAMKIAKEFVEALS